MTYYVQHNIQYTFVLHIQMVCTRPPMHDQIDALMCCYVL